jgi:hypothetical protein
MSARPMLCPGCGEQQRLHVLDYVPPGDVGALVRYECLVCGLIMEHWTEPMTAETLARYGYSGPAT